MQKLLTNIIFCYTVAYRSYYWVIQSMIINPFTLTIKIKGRSDDIVYSLERGYDGNVEVGSLKVGNLNDILYSENKPMIEGYPESALLSVVEQGPNFIVLQLPAQIVVLKFIY